MIIAASLSFIAVAIGAPAGASPDAAAAIPSPPSDVQPSAAIDFASVLDEVLRRNQDLAALASDREAAGHRAVAASAFPNPSVGFAVRSLPVPSFSFTDDEMTMTEVMVRQPIPWFGKRDLRREVGTKDADIAAALGGLQRLALAEATADAYAELWLARASREAVDRQLEALERLAQLARSRFASGGARQADVLRAESELAQIHLPLYRLEEQEAAASARLAALLASETAVRGAPSTPLLPILPDEHELFAGLDSHPELRVLSEREAQARVEARLATREKWPDPEVGLAYGFRIGMPDMIGAEVVFPIPVFAGSNQDRQAAAARADAEAASRRRSARRDSLVADVRSAWAAVRQQAQRLHLYEEEILPRGRRTGDAALGAYQAGGVDFLTVLDAEVLRFGQELEVLSARADYLRARARLARAAGSLDTLFSLNAGGSK